MSKDMTIDEFFAEAKKITNIGEPLFRHRLEIEHYIDWIHAIEIEMARRPNITNADLALATLAELKMELNEAATKVTRILEANDLRRSGIALYRTVARTVEKGRTPKVLFTRYSVKTRLKQVGAFGGFAPLVLRILSEFKETEEKFGLTTADIKELMIPRAGERRSKIDQKSLACLTRLTEYDLVRANGITADREYLYIASPAGRYVVAS